MQTICIALAISPTDIALAGLVAVIWAAIIIILVRLYKN